MANHVNYYDVLEISKTSSSEEIKKGYNKLAKKWHPDRNPDKVEEATEKFKEIAAAYAVLSDPQKKEIYDKHGYEGLQQSSDGSSSIDPMEMFEQLQKAMGGMGGFGGFSEMFGMQQQEDENGGVPDLQVPLRISLKDAYNGKKTTVEVERIALCDKCDGTGAKDKTAEISCKQCDGSGKTTVQMRQGPFMQIAQTVCKTCKGSGINPNVEKCKKCDGNKGSKETVKLEVTVPRGVFEKFPVVVEEEGHAIPKDNIRGTRTKTDVVVVILDAQSDETFKRGPLIPEKGGIDPADLMIDIDVSFAESLSGFYKEIPHLDGHNIKILMSEPCRHGDTYVVRGEGMPRHNKTGHFGDLVVQFNVEHPKTALVDEKLKSKVVDSLGGKHFKVPKKTTPHEMITIEQYRKDAKIKSTSEKMRQQFKKGHGRHKCDDEDCDEDSDSSGENERQGGGPPQCPVQ